MPDEKTYGFSIIDATDLMNNIRSAESWYPEIKPRGGRTQMIELFFAFELTGDMVSNAGAAVIKRFDGASLGDTVDGDTVYDPTGIFSILETGGTGICVKQGGLFYIYNANCPAIEEEEP
jgi:hypothetical protein